MMLYDILYQYGHGDSPEHYKRSNTKTMSKLHHRSMRYELQEWREHTLSWKPIAHANTIEEIVGAYKNAQYRTHRKKKHRVLDRKDGADKAIVVDLD